MEIEQRAVARALRAAAPAVRARVVRTGIGKDRIAEHARRLAAESPPPAALILAGVCGGLAHTAPLPSIARVIDEHGHAWAGGIGFAPGATGAVTLVGVDRIVATPADKAALARGTGAAIVDMESHAFAALCESLGVRWSVVRGVSDTPDESLPAEVLGWIDAEGRSRAGRAVLDMARRPSLIPHMIRVLRRSSRVLPLVARRAVEIAMEVESAAGPLTPRG